MTPSATSISNLDPWPEQLHRREAPASLLFDTNSDYARNVRRENRDARFRPSPRRTAAMTASATRTIRISISRPNRKTRSPADAKKLTRPPKRPVSFPAAGFAASDDQLK